MDDVTTSTRTTVQMNHLLGELQRFLSWGRLEVKPGKCRALVLEKGMVKDRNVQINGVKIQSVKEKSIKYLGKVFNHKLHDREQTKEAVSKAKDSIKKIDRCALAGRYKAWILQNLLLPRLMWPLTIYSIPQSSLEEVQRSFTSHIKKWLGFPRSLSTEMMYSRSSKLQLPYKSVVEEVKVARVRSKMILETSKDACIAGAEISLDAGRKWKVSTSVDEAKSKLRIQEIAGIANRGKEGLGMMHRQYWSAATTKERRGMIVQKTREAEEEKRLVKAAGLAAQGSNMKWNCSQKILSERDINSMPESRLAFLVKAVYDLLPTPANKNRWYKTEEFKCQLCGETATLNHILTGCKVALAQGRYTWRHNRVLEEIARWVDKERKVNNQQPVQKKKTSIKFVKAGCANTKTTPTKNPDCYLTSARDWKLLVDLPGSRLVVPEYVAETAKRPDMLLISLTTKQVAVTELTVPREDRFEVAAELKTTKYTDIQSDSKRRGWKTTIFTVEVGCRGFAASSLRYLLKSVGVQGKERKTAIKKIEGIAENCSNMIWKWSHYTAWGKRSEAKKEDLMYLSDT